MSWPLGALAYQSSLHAMWTTQSWSGLTCGGKFIEKMLANLTAPRESAMKSPAIFPTLPIPGSASIRIGSLRTGLESYFTILSILAILLFQGFASVFAVTILR